MWYIVSWASCVLGLYVAWSQKDLFLAGVWILVAWWTWVAYKKGT